MNAICNQHTILIYRIRNSRVPSHYTRYIETIIDSPWCFFVNSKISVFLILDCINENPKRSIDTEYLLLVRIRFVCDFYSFPFLHAMCRDVNVNITFMLETFFSLPDASLCAVESSTHHLDAYFEQKPSTIEYNRRYLESWWKLDNGTQKKVLINSINVNFENVVSTSFM